MGLACLTLSPAKLTPRVIPHHLKGLPIMSTIIVIILALIAGPTFNADGTYLVDDRVSGVAMCMDTAIHVSACIDSIMATEFDN